MAFYFMEKNKKKTFKTKYINIMYKKFTRETTCIFVKCKIKIVLKILRTKIFRLLNIQPFHLKFSLPQRSNTNMYYKETL
jgi:hypothetical protein